MKVILLVVCFLGLFSLLHVPVFGGTDVSERLRGTNNRNNDSVKELYVREQEREHERKLNPIFCGCTGCNAVTLSTLAGTYSCGARINWLRETRNFSERDACIQVAGTEFPTQCAICNPETCDTVQPPRPSPSPPPPTPSPLPPPSQDNCGCPECDDVWNVVVNSFSCGQRIGWLQSDMSTIAGGPYEETVACSMVASEEYPIECGKCDPSKCNNNSTESPTKTPTNSPTLQPTVSPTASPTNAPTVSPTNAPTNAPTETPTQSPTNVPTKTPTRAPTSSPTSSPVDDEINVCGCPTCVDSIWNTFAGEFKCGSRIEHLQNSLGFTERDACSRIAGSEFPVECGGCDPDRCVELQPNFNNNNNNNDNNNPSSSGEQKCGGAVNSSNDSNRVCQDDLWDPTGDSSMHCFAYGGSGDPCHLSNNNDPDDGRFKDPAMCFGDTLYLWDEPDTQGRSYDWAGRTWLDYSRRFSNELVEMRSTRGTKVTSPMLKAGGPGELLKNLNDFFNACGPPCVDRNDPAYIDVIAINAFCGDFNGPAGCRGGAAFIYNEAINTSSAFNKIPVYITNWSRLQTDDPEDQIEAIDAIEQFFPSSITTDADRVVKRVYWFGATDFGGGSSNNFLTNVLSGGSTLGELWRNKCESL